MKKIVLGLSLVAAVTTSAFAMEVMVKDTMMKKDDAMMKASGTMMVDDKMMKKDDAMMMKKMSRSEEISGLQTLLIEKGYLIIPAGVAKGTFGPKTRMALVKFQKANGLNASGYFGPLTKEKISMMKDTIMKKDDAMMKDDMKKMDDKMMKASATMIKTN